MAPDATGPVAWVMHRMMRPDAALPYIVAASVMWIVMMVAMMAPAALLMVAIFRRMRRSDRPDRDSSLFASGYLIGWSAFGVVAAVLQWWLHHNGWISGMALASSGTMTAALLIAAGAYQLTPLKEACLARCQTPMAFFLENWREGALGALQMGLRHSAFCVGCCWVLMLLMFAGGAMSLLTMAALCGFVLVERLAPAGPWLPRVPGIALLVWGVALLFV